MRARLLILPLLAVLLGCNPPAVLPTAGAPTTSEPPAAPREFRAVWIATVANIDWPSKPGLPVAQQQAEALDIIGKARTLGLNALILQVRPGADALYESSLEPWSEFLTGTQGQAPEPRYDPLAFWIQESHRAGLELHAWFNPYRARPSAARSALTPSHVGVAHPQWVRAYGDQLWLDPSEPAAEAHTLAVILDVVRRYDVDGVHLDDYFYPYPIQDAFGKPLDFPDESDWQTYLAAGGKLSRADWRRSHVDRFIEQLYAAVHSATPQVRVGLSPFGLGRPDLRPAGITGFSQYDELYAHPERWLEQGWLDYLVPQLYWKRDSTGQAFGPLLDYWRAQNKLSRHVWPGLFTSRTGAKEPWPVPEILGQIQLTRDRSGDMGHAHFSAVALRQDYGGLNAPLAKLYGGQALVPATPWLQAPVPAVPRVRLRTSTDASRLAVEPEPGGAWLLALWVRYGETWHFFAVPGGGGTIPAQVDAQRAGQCLVSAVGRTGLESQRVPVLEPR